MQKEKLVYQCLRSWFDQPSNVELKEKMHKEIQLYFSSTISLLKMVLDKVMVFSYITKNSTKKVSRFQKNHKRNNGRDFTSGGIEKGHGEIGCFTT